MSWKLQNSDYHLAEKCIVASPQIKVLAEQIDNFCYSIIPAAWKRLSAFKSRRDSFFFRLVVPLAELTGWPRRQAPSLPSELAAHLLWCYAWRALDDVIDQPTRSTDDLANLLFAQSIALTLTTRCIPRITQNFISQINSLQQMCCDAGFKERGKGLAVEEAWKRCSQCFIVPKVIWKMTGPRIDLYKRYINVIGLTHDVHDLLSDIKLGINSPPVRWLSEIDIDFPFRPQMTTPWFERARKELSATISKSTAQLKPECRILGVHIAEAIEIADELNGK